MDHSRDRQRRGKRRQREQHQRRISSRQERTGEQGRLPEEKTNNGLPRGHTARIAGEGPARADRQDDDPHGDQERGRPRHNPGDGQGMPEPLPPR